MIFLYINEKKNLRLRFADKKRIERRMIEKIGKDVNRKKVRNEKYFELEKERKKEKG